jgi:hypothetical protein
MTDYQLAATETGAVHQRAERGLIARRGSMSAAASCSR